MTVFCLLYTSVSDHAGNVITQIKAVGYGLPISSNLRFDMNGHWTKNPKHGLQFEVETYEEVIVPTREGVIAYLSSGQIKGIGPKLAERIYDSFGSESLEVLDKDCLLYTSHCRRVSPVHL